MPKLTLSKHCIVSLILLNSSFLAQADDLSLQLDQQVITGTKTNRILLDTPVRTEIITRQDIERLHARNLKEVLTTLPGAQLQKIHGKTGYEVWLQGVSADRVLVLIDGEPVSATTGSTVDLTQIGTINIDRVEVVKGATSALHGSNAIGGVINVITRSFNKPISYSLQADLGSYGDKNINGEEFNDAQRSASGVLAVKRDKWYSSTNFDLNETDGFKVDDHHWNQEGPFGEKNTGHFTAGLTPSENQEYFIGADYYHEDTEYRSSYPNPGKPDILRAKQENLDRRTLKAGANLWNDNWGDWKLRFFSERLRDTTYQDVVSTDFIDQKRHAEVNTRKATTQWNLELNDQHTLVAGVDYEEQSLKQYTWTRDPEGRKTQRNELVEPRAERSNTQYYLQDDYQVTSRLEVLPGVRFQNDSDFGDYLTPKINGRFDLTENDANTQQFIRFGLGRGYRVPNLKERYFIFDHSQNYYMVIGNPDLRPESSKSYQLSWAITKPGSYYLDISLFRNELKDLISSELTEAGSPNNGGISTYSYVNVGRAKTQGAELSSTLTPINNFKWSFSYTYLEARNVRTDEHLNKRPRHQVKTNFDYQPFDGPITLSLLAQWQSKAWYEYTTRQDAVSWSRFDFKTNYQLTKTLKLYFGIDNLTDTHRDFSVENDLRPDEGRFAYIGFNFANY